MKIEFNKKYTTISVYTVITFSICFGIVMVVMNIPWIAGILTELAGLLAPITWGVVFAFLMNPVMKIAEKILRPIICRKREHKRILRALSVIISTIVFLGIIAATFSIIIPALIQSFQSIAENFYSYFESLQNWVMRILEDFPEVKERVIEIMSDWQANWYQYLYNFSQQLTNLDFENIRDVFFRVGGGAVNILNALMNALIGIIIMVYLLLSKEIFIAQAKKITTAIFPSKTANLFIGIGTKLNKTIGGFVNGKIIDSIIIGLICFVGMSIMKMEYAALISIIIGITNVIPFFGPFIGAIPSGLLLLIAAPSQVIPFVIFIFVLQQFDGNVLGPRILGDSTGLSAFWVMVAIFIGGRFGFGGMILGVPLFAVMYTVIKDFIEYLLKKKDLPYKTTEYMTKPAVAPPVTDHKSFRLTKNNIKKSGKKNDTDKPE
jgi:predicted PurR-regulated permease PerM